MALQNSYQRSETANFHMAAIMDSLSDGVLTLDRAGRITHINHLAAKSLGINYRNAEGSRLADMMFPENEFFLSKVSASRRLNSEPLLVRRKNDVVRLAVSCTPLTNRDSKILETVVVLQPIQQYKHLIERVSGTRAKIIFDDIIGESNQLKSALNLAAAAAKSDSNVLLLGESSVGKEMFAQAIHNASNRSNEPFFAINCAALPRELISSELFGYEEGAFTGARKGGNPGKFELADQGTLFLDEIGEMPIDLQGTLLRFLEEGTLIRLGGREQIPVNVRIIAATNKKLLEEVKKGNFRLDLYYRLEVIDIKIPPLRERKNDIPDLIHYFIHNMGPRLGKAITGIDSKAMSVLLNYDWPGNVRELNNVIERAIHFSSGSILTAEVLPPEMTTGNKEFLPEMGETLNKDLMEEQLIIKCLRKHRGNKSLAAAELGMSRATIYRKISKYSIM
jgi:transcriptional regulator with PAS, ATPase and Fis domain